MGGTVRLTVLVTGATGRQGGAVARLMIDRGHRVRAFTRRPDSAPAQDLRRRGAEILAGSYDDGPSIERAARGADAVFLVAPSLDDPGTETRHVINAAEAARTAGVKHLVYSSVAGADRKTGIPFFESKQRAEHRLHTLDLPYTVIGPVSFMENLLSPWMLPGLQQGRLSMALPSSRRLQQIGIAEVAGFVAMAIERRDQFLGRRIDIASDEPTGVEMAEILSKVSGSRIEYAALPIGELRVMNADLAKMYEWLDRGGYKVDIAALRREFPVIGWRTFEEWARAQNWTILSQ